MQTVYEHHYAELQKKKGKQKNSGKLSDLNTLCHRDSTGVVNHSVSSHNKKIGEVEQRILPILSQDIIMFSDARLVCTTLKYKIWNHICIGRRA